MTAKIRRIGKLLEGGEVERGFEPAAIPPVRFDSASDYLDADVAMVRCAPDFVDLSKPGAIERFLAEPVVNLDDKVGQLAGRERVLAVPKGKTPLRYFVFDTPHPSEYVELFATEILRAGQRACDPPVMPGLAHLEGETVAVYEVPVSRPLRAFLTSRRPGSVSFGNIGHVEPGDDVSIAFNPETGAYDCYVNGKLRRSGTVT